MKRWFVVFTVLVIIGGLAGVNTLLYFQQSRDMNAALDTVSHMQQEHDALEQEIDLLLERLDGINNLVTGFDQQYNNLRTEIEELSGLIGSFGGDVSALDTNVTSVLSEMDAFQAAILELEQQIGGDSQPGFNVRQIAAGVEPGIVYIEARYFGFSASGSGIIVSGTGHVITNYHVVEFASSMFVTTAAGERFSAALLEYDYGRDLAMLKIDSSRTDFPAAKLGDSAELRPGDDVIAIGFPYPLGDQVPGQAAVTRGIVSVVKNFDGYSYIQTDTAMNPGNSGGALVNAAGEVIGINVAKYVDIDIEGIAFAIPINEARAMMQLYAG